MNTENEVIGVNEYYKKHPKKLVGRSRHDDDFAELNELIEKLKDEGKIVD